MIVAKTKIEFLNRTLKKFVDTQKVSMIQSSVNTDNAAIEVHQDRDNNSMQVEEEHFDNPHFDSLNKKTNNQNNQKKTFNLYEIKGHKINNH